MQCMDKGMLLLHWYYNDLKEYFYLYLKKHLKAFFHRKAQYWHNYFHIVYSRCFGLSENN